MKLFITYLFWIKYHHDEYNAKLNVSLDASGLHIEQPEEACCRNNPEVSSVRPYEFKYKPDADCLLLCVVKEGDKELFLFNMRKIS